LRPSLGGKLRNPSLPQEPVEESALGEQLSSARVEAVVEGKKEPQGLRGEDLGDRGEGASRQGDPGRVAALAR